MGKIKEWLGVYMRLTNITGQTHITPISKIGLHNIDTKHRTRASCTLTFRLRRLTNVTIERKYFFSLQKTEINVNRDGVKESLRVEKML